MATITVVCRGSKWQDDFSPLIPRIGRYFGAIFQDPRDRDDRVQEAYALLATDFQRNWDPGKTIQLQMRFTLVDIIQGKQAATGRGRGKKLKLHSGRERLLARVRQRMLQLEGEIDFRLALASVSNKHREIVRLVMEGYSFADIGRMTGACLVTVKRAIHKVLDLL